MRAPNLDHLRSFATLVELGSFSATARRLHLTQPAISLQIRQLEKRFGVRLIERVGRHVRPTPAGEKLLAQVRRIEEAVSEAVRVVTPYQDERVGRVVLGTGASACIYLLPPVLGSLRRRFPALQILVRTGNTSDILKLLEDNVLDVGLVTAPAAGRPFTTVASFDDEQVALFPKRGMTIPRSITAVALSEQPLLLYEPGGNTRRVIDEWFERSGVAASPVMELGSVEAIKELVGAGLGCAIVPRMATAGSGGRFTVRSLSPPLHRKLVVVLRRDKVLHGGLRRLLQALEAVRLSS